MRQALIVGIDDYPNKLKLNGCVKDAETVGKLISRNDDGSNNFDTTLLINVERKVILKNALLEFFMRPSDISLFYFSGHGKQDFFGFHMVTPDFSQNDLGVPMNQLLTIIHKSPAKNKVIILDCCYSGGIGIDEEMSLDKNAITLHDGITIIASSKYNEPSTQINGSGTFTTLLIEALKGGAADLNGDISAANIYTYIDKAMGKGRQRPVFKANVSGFVTLRKVNQIVQKDIIRKLPTFFADSSDKYPLNPSFECTNTPEVPHEYKLPYAVGGNVKKFGQLQKLASIGLITPVDAEHMYHAAMEAKSCKLTLLGQHYWRLAKDGLI
jgi:Caspase domain